MLRVTCAIIRNEDDEILIVQRGEATDHPLKWEFPGGKTLKGESDEQCIIREIDEELSMGIVICSTLPPVEHDYGHKKILLIPFVCDTLDELPFLSEHISFRWVSVSELASIDFSEADIYVARSYISKFPGKEIAYQSIIDDETDPEPYDAELQKMVNSMMSQKEAEWVAASAGDNPAIFKKLFEYSFSEDKKLAFRASWTLSKVCDTKPELIYPYLNQIVEMLDKIDNESVQRSFLRIITLTDLVQLSQKHHGLLADHCFAALRSGFSAVAIKAYSMEVLYNLAVIYPELVNELSATIAILQVEASGGILARCKMTLKKLAQIPVDPKSSQPLS